MAEGLISDHAETFDGYAVPPLNSRNRPECEFRHNRPGFCSLYQEQIATALDIHMMNVHLELEQLWRCLVEWCTVWKGSVSDCLSHIHDKHGGSQYVAGLDMSVTVTKRR